MKKISILIVVLFFGSKLVAQTGRTKLSKSTLAILHADSLKRIYADSVFAHTRDSAKMAIMAINLAQQAKLMTIDSIRQLIKRTKADTLKAPLYTELASRFMVFDTLNEAKNLQNQNTALTYTMLALHQYMAYSDAVGMRMSYNNLGNLYLLQKRYSEAKWYVLQSAQLSRNRKDVVNIIGSLVTLADIKGQIGDYKLAQKDLDEALALSIKARNKKLQLQAIKTYTLLYSRMKEYNKEDIMLKRQEALQKEIDNEGIPTNKAKPKHNKSTKK